MGEFTVEEANEYFHCMDILKARERLVENEVSSWSNIKKESRDKIHKELIRKADLVTDRKRALTGQDLKRILGNG